jgi:3-oxoacyl-[acyl-carrier-protein] synthase II
MRVLVSGVGIVSPLAWGARATMDRLMAGDGAIRPLALFSLPDVGGLAAEVPDMPPAQPGLSRADQMAIFAAREALAAARIERAGDVELFVAGSTGGMFECEAPLAALKRDIGADVEREVLRVHPLSAAADRIHEALGPFARTSAVCSACSGGATAILLAAGAIESGRLERALAGGVDALCRLTYAGFSALGAVDRAPCRPFDESRAGLSLGEGAAFLLLESEASLAARGGDAIAELGGWAIASEAHHITHPEPSGETAARVMAAALAHAGIAPADVDYLNAHGTATPHNDPMEAAAILRCFGEHARRLRVSSIKGAIGHTLGAAGAIEAAVTALTVAEQRVPPTLGLASPDPACDLRHVLQGEATPVRAAMSNAFGFGGTDTALLFRRPEPAARARATPPRRALCITGAACLGPLGLHAPSPAADGGALAYIEPGPRPRDEPSELPAGALDPLRARRLDRASRMVTLVIERALGTHGLGTPVARAAGLVVGTAHGSVGATGQILRRIFEKGARFASPGHFPSVLPSAVAANPSIYLGLTGPVLSCSDLSTSAEAAVVIAMELVASGACDVMIAAAVDEHNEVAAVISAPLTCGLPHRGARAEGAAALAIEPLERAVARALAVIAWSKSWRGAAPELPAPSPGAAVFMVRAGEIPAAWRGVPAHVIAERAGDHESVGGLALVAAVAAIAQGVAEEVLVLGTAPDRGYAWALRRPGR